MYGATTVKRRSCATSCCASVDLPPPLSPMMATTLGWLLIFSRLATLLDALLKALEQDVDHDQTGRESQVDTSFRSWAKSHRAMPSNSQEAFSDQLGVLRLRLDLSARKHLHAL